MPWPLPLRARVRQGDWKLVWRAPLPSLPELYNIAQDPYEKKDVAAEQKCGSAFFQIDSAAGSLTQSCVIACASWLLAVAFTAARADQLQPPPCETQRQVSLLAPSQTV